LKLAAFNLLDKSGNMAILKGAKLTEDKPKYFHVDIEYEEVISATSDEDTDEMDDGPIGQSSRMNNTYESRSRLSLKKSNTTPVPTNHLEEVEKKMKKKIRESFAAKLGIFERTKLEQAMGNEKFKKLMKSTLKKQKLNK